MNKLISELINDYIPVKKHKHVKVKAMWLKYEDAKAHIIVLDGLQL